MPERYCNARDGRGPHGDALGVCGRRGTHEGPHMDWSERTGVAYEWGASDA